MHPQLSTTPPPQPLRLLVVWAWGFHAAVQKDHWLREYAGFAGMFFIHAMAMGMWLVPLASVLDAHGLGGLTPYAFATGGVAAFISPLIFGALADQRIAPVRLLRWLALASGGAMALASLAIERGWSHVAILAFIQLYALCGTPTWSLSTTIVLSGLREPRREFGPVRAMATVGWMVGCWLISALGGDGSTMAGFGGALMWLGLVGFTFTLPIVEPVATGRRLSWGERLGLDALSLLRNRDHRVVFITAALYNIPLCAFYPYTPKHLRELGLGHTAAWMTLGQVTEIIAMLALATLLARWRLKTIFLLGIGFGVLRFVLCAVGSEGWLLAGVTLHGFAFVLYLITAQIYLEQRVAPEWRARAQALFTLMLSGFGTTLGYLSCGAWFTASTVAGVTHWRLFWLGLAGAVGVVFVFFAVAYRGVHGGERDLNSEL